MKTLTSVQELSAFVGQIKQNKQSLGFVPTMGYLHDGHLSLVKRARSENDRCVVSIFVNPKQFGPQEDLAKYPRDIFRDSALLEAAGIDVLFVPDVQEMYPKGQSVRSLQADPALSSIACGQKRPGHFDGVVTVVARLFDLVCPERAYFGLKDYQQYLIIKKMVEQEGYPIEIIGCPLVREADGLALSSRNSYLSATERQKAILLFRSLQTASKLVAAGVSKVVELKRAILEVLQQDEAWRVDYLEILDHQKLQPVLDCIAGRQIILLAVYLGQTRLIDNIFI